MTILDILNHVFETPLEYFFTVMCIVVIYVSYLWWKRRNDGDYTVIHQKVIEDIDGNPRCSIDLLCTNSGKLIRDLKISWKHQVFCTNPVYSVRIKYGVLYLLKKSAQKETLILLERKDSK